MGESITAYRKAFARRVAVNARNGALPFANPEPSALLALAHVWECDAASKAGSRTQALEMLVTITKPLFEHARGHSVSLDIAGLAWIDAYGVLPIRTPPIEQLEWVLESGNHRGAVSGVLASAWRAAFLASTHGLLDWEHRPIAARERDRWRGYLHSKLNGAAQPSDDPSAYSLNARLAFVVGLAALRASDAHLRDAAEEKLDRIDVEAACAGEQTASAVLAQIGASNHLLGHAEAGDRCVRCLLARYLDPETFLIETGIGEGRRPEFSPWIIISLLAAQRA